MTVRKKNVGSKNWNVRKKQKLNKDKRIANWRNEIKNETKQNKIIKEWNEK